VRAVNRVAGLILGLALLGLGLFTIVQTVALTVFDKDWPAPVLVWRDDLSTVPWSDGRVLLAAICAGVLGLLILVLELRRVRPAWLGAAWHDDEDDWRLRRRSVQRRAASAARSVRGVDAATAATSGRKQDWQVAVTARTVGDVVDPHRVEAAVREELHTIGAPERVPVTVRLRRIGSRS
jgi:hypothetical protein